MFLLIILSLILLLQGCQTRVVVLQLAVKSINDTLLSFTSFRSYHTLCISASIINCPNLMHHLSRTRSIRRE